MQVVRDPSQSSQVKEVNAEKQKVYTAILSDYCVKKLTVIFQSTEANNSWASVPNLDFLDQQKIFATCVSEIDPSGKGSLHS